MSEFWKWTSKFLKYECNVIKVIFIYYRKYGKANFALIKVIYIYYGKYMCQLKK